MIYTIARGFVTVALTATVALVPGLADTSTSSFLVPVAVAEAPVELDPFYGYPTLKRICSCESNLTHFEHDGETVLRGKINRYDIGICQINEYYQKERIQSLGVDIYTEEGNVAFAKHLYNERGEKPWRASKVCWAS